MNKFSIDEIIFNKGVQLASEFGENWLNPIQDQLMLEFAFLSRDHVDFYNKICIKARDEAYKFVFNQMSDLAGRKETISKTQSFALFEIHMQLKYPMLNEENLKKLYSQGCYYCWKDGMIPPLENE